MAGYSGTGLGLAQNPHHPFLPVDIELKMDQETLRAKIKVNVIYWEKHILGEIKKSGNWPPEAKKLVKEYVDNHFKIAVENKVLKSEILDCRYHSEIWDTELDRYCIFHFVYRVPEGVRKLDIRSDFYVEEWREVKHLIEKWTQTIPVKFLTNLYLSGAESKKIILPIEDPEVQIRIEQIQRSFGQKIGESIAAGFFTSFHMSVLMLILFILFLNSEKLSLKTHGFTALILYIFSGVIMQFRFSSSQFNFYPWAFLVMLTVLTWFNSKEKLWKGVTLAAALFGGFVIANSYFDYKLISGFNSMAGTGYAFGIICGLGLEIGILWVVRLVYERIQKNLSSENYRLRYHYHRRIMAVIVGIIAAKKFLDSF